MRVLLSELELARVRCKKCGAVAEVKLDDLGMVTSCPACREDWRGPDGNVGMFNGLANAIRAALGKKSVAEVEFVLREKS